MGFARRDPNSEDAIQWNRIQAQLESAEGHDPDEPLLIEGLVTQSTKPSSDDEGDTGRDMLQDMPPARPPPPRPKRASRGVPRAPARPLPRVASPEIAAERLPRIKAAAARMKRLKKAAISPDKTYRKGKVLFDPGVQRFGFVVYSSPGYVRLEMRDGTQSTQGKPPLDDRKNFVLANFERMSNKVMAEILEISVHTMRRLCHEYGLRRHGKSKAMEKQRKTA